MNGDYLRENGTNVKLVWKPSVWIGERWGETYDGGDVLTAVQLRVARQLVSCDDLEPCRAGENGGGHSLPGLVTGGDVELLGRATVHLPDLRIAVWKSIVSKIRIRKREDLLRLATGAKVSGSPKVTTGRGDLPGRVSVGVDSDGVELQPASIGVVACNGSLGGESVASHPAVLTVDGVAGRGSAGAVKLTKGRAGAGVEGGQGASGGETEWDGSFAGCEGAGAGEDELEPSAPTRGRPEAGESLGVEAGAFGGGTGL